MLGDDKCYVENKQGKKVGSRELFGFRQSGLGGLF